MICYIKRVTSRFTQEGSLTITKYYQCYMHNKVIGWHGDVFDIQWSSIIIITMMTYSTSSDEYNNRNEDDNDVDDDDELDVSIHPEHKVHNNYISY